MVPTEILLGPVVAVFSTLATIFAASAVQIWRKHHDVSDRRNEVENNEEEIRNRMVGRIAEILLVAINEVFDGDPSVEKKALKEAIISQLHETELNKLVPAFTDGGLPCARFDECLDKYKKAYQQVGLSALGVVSIPVLILTSFILGGDPFSYAFDIAHGMIGVLSAMLLYRGVVNFNKAESIRNEIF